MRTPIIIQTTTKIDAMAIIGVSKLLSSYNDVDRVTEAVLLLPLFNVILFVVGFVVDDDVEGLLVVDELLPPVLLVDPPVFVVGLSVLQVSEHLLLQHIRPRSQFL